MASDSSSSAAGRGSGRGGLALACSAGDNVGTNGDRGALCEEMDGTAEGSACAWDCETSIGENGVAGWDVVV